MRGWEERVLDTNSGTAPVAIGVEGDVLKCSQASIVYLSSEHLPPHRAESQPKRFSNSFVSTLSSTPSQVSRCPHSFCVDQLCSPATNPWSRSDLA